MKHEYQNKDVFCKEIIADSRAAKRVCDATCMKLSSNSITGFLQKIEIDDFGLLFFSEIQVKMLMLFKNS